MTYILDTNIILRTLIREEDNTFKECTKVMENIKGGFIEAIVPGVVTAETMWVLNSFYQMTKSTQIKAIKSILNIRGLKVEDDYDYKKAVTFYEQQNVKYVDCLIASLAEKRKGVVLTYDKEFSKLPVKWLTPTKLLASLK